MYALPRDPYLVLLCTMITTQAKLPVPICSIKLAFHRIVYGHGA
jgi:hypothetical protein